MNRSKYFDYIEEKLSTLLTRIELRAKNNILDLNIFSETLFENLLNLIFTWKLKNQNTKQQNIAAIDLVDSTNKIVVQVSSTYNKGKIESSLAKPILAQYSQYCFKFMALSKEDKNLKKQTFNNPHNINFNPETDIIDISDILKIVLGMSIEEMKDVYELIQKEFDIKSIINRLLQNSKTKLQSIPKQIGRYLLERRELRQKIQEKLATIDKNIVILTGSTGVGKSAILSDILLEQNTNTFFFKSEQLKHPTLSQTFSEMGVDNIVLKDFFMQLSCFDNFIIVIDGAEKLLEYSQEGAFQELLALQHDDHSFKIILTCRSNMVDSIKKKFRLENNTEQVEVSSLDELEKEDVFNQFPFLRQFNVQLNSLLIIPKYLDFIVRVSNKQNKLFSLTSYKGLREELWSMIVLDSMSQSTGVQQQNIKEQFLQIILNTGGDKDTSIIIDLEKRGIINLIDTKLYANHDILEDWGIMEYTQDEFNSSQFEQQISDNYVLQKGLYLWIEESILDQKDNIFSLWLKDQLNNKNFILKVDWLNELLIKIFYSDYTSSFFILFEKVLLNNDARLLVKCFTLIKISCKSLLGNEITKLSNTEKFILIPTGVVWDKTICFIHKFLSDLTIILVPISEFITEYSIRLVFITSIVPLRETVEQSKDIIYYLLTNKNELDNSILRFLVNIFYNLADFTKEEIQQLVTEELKNKNRYGLENNPILRGCLNHNVPEILIKNCPELIIKVMWDTWIFESSR